MLPPTQQAPFASGQLAGRSAAAFAFSPPPQYAQPPASPSAASAHAAAQAGASSGRHFPAHLQREQPMSPSSPQAGSPDAGSSSGEASGGGAAQGQDYARPYRSRKERPCDLCRRRKGRCVIEEAGKKCQACQLSGRPCTFEMSPTPRSRPERREEGSTSGAPQAFDRMRHSSGPSQMPMAHQSPYQAHAAPFGNDYHTASVLQPHHRRQSTNPRFQPYPLSASTSHESMSQQLGNGAQTGWSAPSPPDSRSLLPPDLRGSSSPHVLLQQRQQARQAQMQAQQTQQAQHAQQAHQAQHAQQHAQSRHPTQPRHEPRERPSEAKSEARSHDTERRSAAMDDLHGLFVKMVQGDDASSENASVTEADEAMSGPPNKETSAESGMTPFVLGSSSSEDPVLLEQAASPDGNASPQVARLVPTSQRAGDGGPQHTTNAVPAAYHVRQVTRDPRKPVFFSFMVSQPYGAAPGRKTKEIGAEGLAKLRANIGDKLGPLMSLYSERDAAAFPLLTTSQRQKFRQIAAELQSHPPKNGATDTEPVLPLPPVLANAVLATPLIYDRSVRHLTKSAWGSNLHALIEQFDVSSLTTLQVACTDLTGRPSINTSGNMMSLMQTLAVAHMLGMHLDPTSWTLPREERDVRIRLWWAIVIHDKWSSLCWGRPSVINKKDHSVPLPKRSGLSPCREHLADEQLSGLRRADASKTRPLLEEHTPGDTFAALAALTQLLDGILAEFHAVHCRRDDSVFVTQRVRAYLGDLDDWRASLPSTLHAVFTGKAPAQIETIPGTRSLQLSYFGIVLLLCRTALDAVTATETFDEARVMPAHHTAQRATEMVVDWLESLTDAEIVDSFFLHYGSHHLASCLSLLARLALGYSRAGQKEQLGSSIDALRRFLILLSSARRKHQWDLGELALTRALAILPQLELRIPNFPRLTSLISTTPPQPTLPMATSADLQGIPADALQSLGGGQFYDETAATLAALGGMGDDAYQASLHGGQPGQHAQHTPHSQHQHVVQAQQHQQQHLQHQPHHQQQPFGATSGQHAFNAASAFPQATPAHGFFGLQGGEIMDASGSADAYASLGASAGPALMLADDWMQLGLGGPGSSMMQGSMWPGGNA